MKTFVIAELVVAAMLFTALALATFQTRDYLNQTCANVGRVYNPQENRCEAISRTR